MISKNNRSGDETSFENGCLTIFLGRKDVWDGADLALLRTHLKDSKEDSNLSSVIIDISKVKYLPSGFYGELCNFYDNTEADIYLFNPELEVKNKHWFKIDYKDSGDGYYLYVEREEGEGGIPTEENPY